MSWDLQNICFSFKTSNFERSQCNIYGNYDKKNSIEFKIKGIIKVGRTLYIKKLPFPTHKVVSEGYVSIVTVSIIQNLISLYVYDGLQSAVTIDTSCY